MLHERLIAKRRLPFALLWMLVGTWSFLELSKWVLKGTPLFDEWAILAFRHAHDVGQPIGPTWMAEAVRDVTSLGGVFVLVLLTSGVASFLRIHHRYRELQLLLVTVITGVTLTVLLKSHFDRPRPQLVPHLSIVDSHSFPSGHTMMATVVYLTLASLVSRIPGRRRWQVCSYAFAICLIAMVGVSRVYLGVHYPTDVLAGWIAGTVWVLFAWQIAAWLGRRESVER